jgi:pimeloyl-ACP methyl ester carboxylesterase
MERAEVDGITLEYQISGTGDPVVLTHGAFIADTFRPLRSEPSISGRYQLISYHRRGYGGSSRTPGPISAERQAADCRALLRYLGVERAHVVGHSFGGAVAIQLALDAPEVVHSLAVLEAVLMVGASAHSYRESLVQSAQRYREVGAAVVMEEFFRARWPRYSRAALQQVIPGAYEQARADAPATFELDLGLLDWEFGEMEARRITQPVLVVLGGGSQALHPRFEETYPLLLNWLPHAEGFVLPGATHFLQVESPDVSAGLADALAAFYARHPLDSTPVPTQHPNRGVA